tara:strand:+ start:72 stop:473 length:402 start_codon:yes stop_codon:yes gene_type:complete
LVNLNFGEIFKSIGFFITKNWQMLGLIGMIILFFATRNDYAALKKSMDVMTISYQEQIASIEELHRKELKLRKESVAKYEKELADLIMKHNEAVEDLEQAKKETIQKFKRDFEEQPEELAQEIEQQYGFKYVK